MLRRLVGTRRVLLAVGLAASGCSQGPSRIKPPAVDADAAARAALEQLDANNDGELNDDELTASPGLAFVKEKYDSDHNGTLNASEIANGLRQWTEGTSGAVAVAYQVRLDGRPLPDAQVKAVPEPFLGAAAKGATGADGYLVAARQDLPANAPNLPLMLPGLFRIEITHPSHNIPARYNSQTTLGLEVSSALRSDQAVVWDLRSR